MGQLFFIYNNTKIDPPQVTRGQREISWVVCKAIFKKCKRWNLKLKFNTAICPSLSLVLKKQTNWKNFLVEFLDWQSRHSYQGATSLTVTAKSSWRRHFFFNDVWRHRHQSLLMTPFVTVIVRISAHTRLLRHWRLPLIPMQRGMVFTQNYIRPIIILQLHQIWRICKKIQSFFFFFLKVGGI